jgi:hypothetical protein
VFALGSMMSREFLSFFGTSFQRYPGAMARRRAGIEARALLLSIDPLAALAQTQEQIDQRLLELTRASS